MDKYFSIETLKSLRTKTQGTLVISANIRSYQKNSDKLNYLITEASPDIVAIQEVWQVPPVNADFDIFTILRTKKRGGGLSILVR